MKKKATPRLFDYRMTDGSRNFADLPETVFFDELRKHLKGLDGAIETGFILTGSQRLA